MIKTLIEFSLKKPLLNHFLLFFIFLLSVFAYFKIPKDINSHEHVANDYLNSEAVQNSMHRYLGK